MKKLNTHHWLGPLVTISLSLIYQMITATFGLPAVIIFFAPLVLLAGYFSGPLGASITAVWAILFNLYLHHWMVDVYTVQMTIGFTLTFAIIWLIYNKPFVNGNSKKMLRALNIMGSMRHTLHNDDLKNQQKVMYLNAYLHELYDIMGNLTTIFWGMAQIKVEFEKIARMGYERIPQDDSTGKSGQ